MREGLFEPVLAWRKEKYRSRRELNAREDDDKDSVRLQR